MARPRAKSSFAARVVAWQRAHGRHDLPWQNTRDPYRIWLSEIMLQQTQVSAVIPYYQRFLAAFPDVTALARAPLDDVFSLWSGLGYYRRAQHLHAAAKVVVDTHNGAFPRKPEALAALPGIGRSTAAAIAALAFGSRAAILDGNVKRVLARHAGIDGWPGAPKVEARLWAIAEARVSGADAATDARAIDNVKTGDVATDAVAPRDVTTGNVTTGNVTTGNVTTGDVAPGDVATDDVATGAAADDVATYTQGLMDLGATLCTRAAPRCEQCPVSADCVARLTGRIAELPAPRPRKVLPQRALRVLLLERSGEWLLEKRPLQGIWGGLWSLPECALDDDVSRIVFTRFAAQVARSEALPPVVHGFTHFGLTLHPQRITVDSWPARAAEPGVVWITPGDALHAALPAPIRTILRSVR